MRVSKEKTRAKGAGISMTVCKVAWVAAGAAFALGAAEIQGMAQDSAPSATQSAIQNQHSGVAKPMPARMTPESTPDAQEDIALPPPIQIAKPAARAETVYGPYVPYRSSGSSAAANAPAVVTSAPAYDEDAHIAGDAPVLARHREDPAKDDPDAGIVTHLPWLPNEIPDGVLLKVKLRESISTQTTKPGTAFSAEVTEPVVGEGRVYLPAGSVLKGRVTWARGGSRISGGAAIHLEARTVTLPDGTEYPLHARVIDTSSWDNTRVDSEGTITRKDHAKETATAMGLATGGGAAAGAMIGGVPGALIGAGVGAGASVVVWLKEDRQAVLPKDLGVVFSLTEPMSVAPGKSGVGTGGE